MTATDTGGDKEKDPFTEKLEQRKKKYQEYANWLNSTNEDIRNSAKTEFAGLLAEGESYEAYLKNIKRELEALPETADRNKKISVVSNELVSIEKILTWTVIPRVWKTDFVSRYPCRKVGDYRRQT